MMHDCHLIYADCCHRFNIRYVGIHICTYVHEEYVELYQILEKKGGKLVLFLLHLSKKYVYIQLKQPIEAMLYRIVLDEISKHITM